MYFSFLRAAATQAVKAICLSQKVQGQVGSRWWGCISPIAPYWKAVLAFVRLGYPFQPQSVKARDEDPTDLFTTRIEVCASSFCQSKHLCKIIQTPAEPLHGVIWSLYADVEVGANSQRVALGVLLIASSHEQPKSNCPALLKITACICWSNWLTSSQGWGKE